MTNFRVGIIGGMGPQASALLHSMIIKKYSKDLGAINNHDYPLIVHVSIPVIDFISDKKAIHKNDELFAISERVMKAIQLDACIVACNTAHIVTDSNTVFKKLPLISLPESVIAAAEARGIKKLGLIASPTTIRSKLYEDTLGSRSMRIIPTSEKLAERSEAIIRKTIAGKAGKAEVRALNAIANELTKRGAEAIALGCTELSVVANLDENLDERYVDSLTATADRLITLIREQQGVKHVKST